MCCRRTRAAHAIAAVLRFLEGVRYHRARSVDVRPADIDVGAVETSLSDGG